MPNTIGLYSTRLDKDMALTMARLSKKAYKKKNGGDPDEGAILTSLKKADKNFVSVSSTKQK